MNLQRYFVDHTFWFWSTLRSFLCISFGKTFHFYSILHSINSIERNTGMTKQLLCLLFPLLVTANIFDMNQKLYRTLNLGNYLEAPNEGDWSNEQLLQEVDFQRIAEKGFTAVRIPIRWNNHLAADTIIKAEFMNRVKWAVDNANKNGLVAVVDDHHFEGLMEDPHANEPVIKRIWEQISEEFTTVPNDSLFFEPVNEPHTNLTSDRWNALFAELVTIIRKTNPTRPIIAGTTGWGGVSGLLNLELPADPNLIATVHYYSPFQFTHQGANWVTGADAWLGTIWSGDYFEKKAIREDLEQVRKWSEEKNIPVFVGEFGAYEKADMESRLLWTHYCARLFESLKLSWAYWEYSSGFGIYDPAAKEWRHDLVDTLLSNDTTTLILDSSSVTYGDELIINGDFAQQKNGWFHNVWGDGAAATLAFPAEGGAVHTVTEAGADFYQIQLIQNSLSLEANKEYLLVADISGDGTAQVGLTIMREDYSSVASGNSIVPSEEGSQLELMIAPTQEEKSVSVVLQLGYSVGAVTIHSISLREFNTEATPVQSTNTKSNSLTASLSGRKISLNKTIPENSRVKLFSIRGQRMLEQVGIANQTINLPSNLSHGWYAMTINHEGRELLRQSFILK